MNNSVYRIYVAEFESAKIWTCCESANEFVKNVREYDMYLVYKFRRRLFDESDHYKRVLEKLGSRCRFVDAEQMNEQDICTDMLNQIHFYANQYTQIYFLHANSMERYFQALRNRIQTGAGVSLRPNYRTGKIDIPARAPTEKSEMNIDLSSMAGTFTSATAKDDTQKIMGELPHNSPAVDTPTEKQTIPDVIELPALLKADCQQNDERPEPQRKRSNPGNQTQGRKNKKHGKKNGGQFQVQNNHQEKKESGTEPQDARGQNSQVDQKQNNRNNRDYDNQSNRGQNNRKEPAEKHRKPLTQSQQKPPEEKGQQVVNLSVEQPKEEPQTPLRGKMPPAPEKKEQSPSKTASSSSAVETDMSSFMSMVMSSMSSMPPIENVTGHKESDTSHNAASEDMQEQSSVSREFPEEGQTSGSGDMKIINDPDPGSKEDYKTDTAFNEEGNSANTSGPMPAQPPQSEDQPEQKEAPPTWSERIRQKQEEVTWEPETEAQKRDAELLARERKIFDTSHQTVQYERFYTPLEDSKAQTVSLMADRLIADIEITVKGIKEAGYDFDTYMALISTLIRSTSLEDFQNCWGVVCPGHNLDLDNVVYRKLRKEAEHYARTCEILYLEDKF